MVGESGWNSNDKDFVDSVVVFGVLVRRAGGYFVFFSGIEIFIWLFSINCVIRRRESFCIFL